MKKRLIRLFCRMLHTRRKLSEILLFDDLYHLFSGNLHIVIEDMASTVTRAHFLDCGFQVMEKLRIGKDCEVIHINGQLAHNLPDLLLFPGQYRLRISRSLTVAPSALFQKLQALPVVLAGDQLVNDSVREQRHFQSTYARNRVGILFTHQRLLRK